jgi:serine/threonine protein phosphatase PrpC
LESDPPAALQAAFVTANAEVMKAQLGTRAGCACVCAYLHDTTLWVANAGDCRAVMAVKESIKSKMVAKDLSRDHKPDVPEERDRIKQCGGFIKPSPGLTYSARVCLNRFSDYPGLAMSR